MTHTASINVHHLMWKSQISRGNVADELKIHSFDGLPVSRHAAVVFVVNIFLIYVIVDL